MSDSGASIAVGGCFFPAARWLSPRWRSRGVPRSSARLCCLSRPACSTNGCTSSSVLVRRYRRHPGGAGPVCQQPQGRRTDVVEPEYGHSKPNSTWPARPVRGIHHHHRVCLHDDPRCGWPVLSSSGSCSCSICIQQAVGLVHAVDLHPFLDTATVFGEQFALRYSRLPALRLTRW